MFSTRRISFSLLIDVSDWVKVTAVGIVDPTRPISAFRTAFICSLISILPGKGHRKRNNTLLGTHCPNLKPTVQARNCGLAVEALTHLPPHKESQGELGGKW